MCTSCEEGRFVAEEASASCAQVSGGYYGEKYLELRGITGLRIFVPLIESQEIQNREPERLEILNRMARDVEQKCEIL